jgi:hypothetical protein
MATRTNMEYREVRYNSALERLCSGDHYGR